MVEVFISDTHEWIEIKGVSDDDVEVLIALETRSVPRRAIRINEAKSQTREAPRRLDILPEMNDSYGEKFSSYKERAVAIGEDELRKIITQIQKGVVPANRCGKYRGGGIGFRFDERGERPSRPVVYGELLPAMNSAEGPILQVWSLEGPVCRLAHRHQPGWLTGPNYSPHPMITFTEVYGGSEYSVTKEVEVPSSIWETIEEDLRKRFTNLKYDCCDKEKTPWRRAQKVLHVVVNSLRIPRSEWPTISDKSSVTYSNLLAAHECSALWLLEAVLVSQLQELADLRYGRQH